ncbi:altered inheritance of mitochondria protein 6 homolog [Trichophyton mentagrophytes]|nr:altered inheritance of mitochondria protein 6 homolog [Trichophyton mentagrophytes]
MKSSILASAAILAASLEPVAALSEPLQNILINTDRSPIYRYPTDVTRGIIPIPVHSHNDYWRDVPFYTALSAGCISIEADVFLFNDTLYVGHEESALTKERTLQSLYIEPLMSVLKKTNPKSPFVSGPTRHGVFDASSGQTLYLWIDVKNNGEKAWPHIVKALQPLRDANYLTKVQKNETFVPGPVTVIGTGGTPLSQVVSAADRDYFYDGPLKDLTGFTSLISPIASTSLMEVVGDIKSDSENPLNPTQLEAIRKQVKAAKDKSIGVRYWETPGWPIRLRNELWRTLWKEGVALLNADDVNAAKEYF